MAKREIELTEKGHDVDTRRQIGERVRMCRTAQSMTQQKLAEKVGRNMSPNSLSRYEKGETEMGIVASMRVSSKES